MEHSKTQAKSFAHYNDYEEFGAQCQFLFTYLCMFWVRVCSQTYMDIYGGVMIEINMKCTLLYQSWDIKVDRGRVGGEEKAKMR